MATLHLPFPSTIIIQIPSLSKPISNYHVPNFRTAPVGSKRRPRVLPGPAFSVGKKETDLQVSTEEDRQQQEEEPNPQDLEYVAQIKRVLELLRKNRDMTFGEVKLTIMIEDPRDIERKILLGIEEPDEITRDDLAAALEDVCAAVLCTKGEFQRIG